MAHYHARGTNIPIPPELLKRLQETARLHDYTVDQALTEAVEAWVGAHYAIPGGWYVFLGSWDPDKHVHPRQTLTGAGYAVQDGEAQYQYTHPSRSGEYYVRVSVELANGVVEGSGDSIMSAFGRRVDAYVFGREREAAGRVRKGAGVELMGALWRRRYLGNEETWSVMCDSFRAVEGNIPGAVEI